MILFRDLRLETREVEAELREAIAGVLAESRFIGGDRVAAFESAFAVVCGAAEAVGVASGTDAITLALRAAGVGHGDEVVTVANTCVPTVAGIAAAGAVPVLVDVDPVTLTMSPESLQEVLGPRTRAVVPVHLYGRPAPMPELIALARTHGLFVLEDAAQGHGLQLAGDAAAFSFYPTKNLGGLGDGGAVVTNDAALADRLRLLRSYGGAIASERSGQSRLDVLQAAALHAKLPHLQRWNERRAELASRYDAAFGVASGGVHHLYVIRVPDRDGFRERMHARGVETAVHYELPIHHHPAWRDLPRADSLRESERAAAEVVSLPLHPQLGDDEADAVIAAVLG